MNRRILVLAIFILVVGVFLHGCANGGYGKSHGSDGFTVFRQQNSQWPQIY